MDNKSKILMNYDKMSGISSKLDEMANQINDMNEREYEIYHEILLEGWKGENALLYDNKLSELRNRMTLIEKELWRVKQDISTAAVTYRDAELKVLEMMEKKSSTDTTE